MKLGSRNFSGPASACQGTTLVEVVMALGVATMAFSGVILGLTSSCQRAEWSAYNFAAQSLAQQGIEQARAAAWDTQGDSPVDNCIQTNFPSTTTNVLDVPISGTNFTYATNKWTITTISTNPYPLKLIRVDTTWGFQRPGKPRRVFTNTVATMRAPNQ